MLAPHCEATERKAIRLWGEGTSMLDVILKRFESPDETRVLNAPHEQVPVRSDCGR